MAKDLTSREKNRRREHEDHGWVLSDQALVESKDGDVLVECPCGWLGWISREAAEEFSLGSPEIGLNSGLDLL